MSLSEEKVIKAATDSYGEAVVVFNKRDYKKAHSLFDEIVKAYADSEYFTVLEIVGKAKSFATMAENQLDKAEDPLKNRDDFLQSAVMKLNAGRLPEALELLEQSSKDHGKDAKTLYLQALIFVRQDQNEKALDALQQAVKLDKSFKIIAHNEPDFEVFREDVIFRNLTA
jgi:tetratricopeptide (TPR) repeat protein